LSSVKHLSFAAAIVIATTASARAERIKVAIVPSVAVNLDAARVDSLGQGLADALVAELDVDAVGGLEVRRRLPPEGIAPDCATMPACAAEVARKLSATQLVFVVMVDSGGGAVQVDPTWVDPATGRTASRPAIDLASIADADARAKFAAAARSLLPDAPLRRERGAPPSLVNRAAVPRHFTVASKITIGVTGATLIAGTILGLDTRSKYNSCAADPTCAANGSSQKSTIRALAAGADASFAIAIGCAAASAILYASSGEASRVMVAPTPNGVAIGASGRF
jgi:hypothetical protein